MNMKKMIGALVVGMLLSLVVKDCFGAAATAAVNTKSRNGETISLGVYTNTIIYQGTIVCMNSSGYAIAGADASGNVVVGMATETVDNRTGATGAGVSGIKTIKVQRGVFGWAQTGSAISDTSIGSLAYVFDSQTVTNASAGNSIIAGVIVDYSDSLVWVDTFHIGRTAGSYTTLAASGAVTAGSTLDVTGATTVGGALAVTGAGTFGNTLGVTGVATFAARPAFTVSNSTAATNATPSVSLPITINGTNVLIKCYPN